MAKNSKSKALNFRINSEKVDIVIRPQQQHQHVSPLGVSVHGTEANPFFFFIVSSCGWEVRPFVWLVFIQTLAVIRTQLNQQGPSEGHFVAVFHLIHQGEAWSPRMANRAKDQEQHNTQ